MACFSIQAQSSLENHINRLVKEKESIELDAGISIRNSQGKEVFSLHSGRKFMPASTLKVITSFIALDILGNDYKYNTNIGYTGNLETDGTLKGDVVIVGSGDPTFGSSRQEIGSSLPQVLSEIHDAIQKTGIKCIDGNVIVYTGIFDEEASLPAWSWSDVGNYYGGGVFGLNMNENEYNLSFVRNKPIGSLTEIAGHEPQIPGMTIENKVTVARPGTGDNAYIYGGHGFYHKMVKGTVPQGKGLFTIRGSMPDPPAYFAQTLYMYLKDQGIDAQNYLIHHVKPDKIIIPITQIYSPPLSEIVLINNTFSVNLYSEALLKTLSDDGSRKSGIQKIKAKMKDEGLAPLSLRMVDGSGLGSGNSITPALFTRFLHHYHKKWGFKNTIAHLPQAGKEGTVRYFLQQSAARNRIWVKSGFIEGVVSYVGFIENKSGQIYTFSILVNHIDSPASTVRKKIEKIIEAVYLYSE